MKIEAPISGYANLKEIRDRIAHAHYDALKTVNKALVGLYWDIGHLITERQQGESWGRAVYNSWLTIYRQLSRNEGIFGSQFMADEIFL